MRPGLGMIKTYSYESPGPPSGGVITGNTAILVFGTHDLREGGRLRLIAAAVCPEILWLLKEPMTDRIPSPQIDCGRRVLSIDRAAKHSEEVMVLVDDLVPSLAES